MSSRIIVRPAEPRDGGAVVTLARAVAAEPEGWLLADATWRSVAAERRFIRAVQRHPDAVLLVAEIDGAIVGRLSAARDPHPASSHVADVGLMVSSGSRRAGVGSAMMRAVEEWARGASISKLELHAFPYNTPAIALYEKLGYRREGHRERHYLRPDGQYVDAILLAKLLD